MQNSENYYYVDKSPLNSELYLSYQAQSYCLHYDHMTTFTHRLARKLA